MPSTFSLTPRHWTAIRFTVKKQIPINNRTIRRAAVVASLLALAVLCGARAEDVKPTDEGRAEAFKGKTFKLKEKGEASIILTFPAGKKASITVKSTKKSDVNLFIYDADKKEVAKDDSPGPDCAIDYTPKDGGKLTLTVRNLGPGENKSTLKVKVEK
jgi:hypothetical protein